MAGIRNMTGDIAHDLKKPIVRIRIAAEKKLFSDRKHDHYDPDAARILEECDYLIQMIDTMLDVSEAQAGAATLDMREFDIADVLARAHELFYPLAEDKGLRFALDVPGPCIVRGDVHKIQRMVANLLDNAVKYTPPGGEVAVTMSQEGNMVRIAVRDTGCGVPESDLPHIFERFYRCDRSRSEPGIGLGLTLAKAIAVSHGGDIAVESEAGKGSVFTVMLPAR
jgi:signal transduction histidine kinase